MSDWRNSDKGAHKPRPAPQPKQSAEQLNPPPTGGWKGRGGVQTSSAPISIDARTWKGSAAADGPPAPGGLRRWLLVGLWFGMAAFLTVLFVAWLMLLPARVPLVVFSVGDYDAPELRANPYGNAQRKRLREVDASNVTFLTEQSLTGNDNGLGTLQNADWTTNFEQLQSKAITPGGPDGRFAIFYVSAYATFDDSDQLWIHSQGVAPFQSSARAQQASADSPPAAAGSIKLSTLLAHLTKSVSKRGIAWVVLDVQLPPRIANLGDLDPQWRTAAEAAINELDESLRSRVIVTMPGDNGQSNWLAPEFAGSFFGHHFRHLLTGHGAERSLIDNSFTLASFRQKLDSNVEMDVANRRYAIQRPLWLPQRTFDQESGKKLVMLKDPKPAEGGHVPDEIRPLFQEIEGVWNRLNSGPHRAGFRWDPLGYAAIESQLLALEEIALYVPEKFSSAKDSVLSSIDQLHKPPIDLKISLIEDRLRRSYFANHTLELNAANHDRSDATLSEQTLTENDRTVLRLAQQLASQVTASDSTKLPAFWLPPPVDDKELEQRRSLHEQQMTNDQRAQLAWQFVIECARSNDSRVWNNLFQLERLQALIEYGQVGGDYLELYLLRRLTDDIDWTRSSPQRSQACVEGLLLFDRIQGLASWPDPEVSWWWLQESGEPVLQGLEREFLHGFDLCLAGKFPEALSKFEQVKSSLPAIEKRQHVVRSAVERLQHALHALPHLLAWQLQEYQFAPEQELPGVFDRLNRLARLANLTHELHSLLKRPPAFTLDARLQPLSEDVATALDTLFKSFADYARMQASEQGGAKINPITFRRSQIALRSPLLSLADRQSLHQNTLPFLRQPVEGGSDKQSGLTERSTRAAGKERFLTNLQIGGTLWSQLVLGDLRRGLDILSDRPLPPTNDIQQLRSRLWDIDYDQRVAAAAFGHYPTFRMAVEERTESTVNQRFMKWPWSAAWQRWNLATANAAILQASRLAEAAWGDGRYTLTTSSDKFYFHRMGSRYTLPAGFSQFPPLLQLHGTLDNQRRGVLDQAAERIKSLSARFGRSNETISLAKPETASIPVQVVGERIPGFAQVFLSDRIKRLSWTSQAAFAPWLVNLDLPEVERSTSHQFSTEYWKSSPPEGNLLFRGNLTSQPLNWAIDDTKQEKLLLTLAGREPQAAELKVISSDVPLLNVLLLVDCSNSMDTIVQIPLEQGGIYRGQLFPKVKDAVQAVMNRFSEIHDAGEARVKMAMMPFGLQESRLTPELKAALVSKKDNCYVPKYSKQLDQTWLLQLSDQLAALVPSGDTPLYRSIVLAMEQVPLNEQALIYVFSDGVNHIEKTESTTGTDRTTVNAVREQLSSRSNVRLNIFHFDFFEAWIRSSPERMKQLDYWQPIFSRGIAELETLNSLGTHYGYYRSDETSKLMEESLASVPRARISVSSRGEQGRAFRDEGKLNEFIKVPMQSLPAELDVKILRPFDTPVSTQVQLLGGESLVLAVDRSGKIVFDGFNGNSFINENRGRRAGGNLSSRLFVRTLNDRIVSEQRLGFRLYFTNEDNRVFTRRPQFLVAEVSPSDTQRGPRIVLADHRFVASAAYPEANFSEFPWLNPRTPVRLRVWAADSFPPQLKDRLVAPLEAQPAIELGIATLNLTVGERLVAEVTYRSTPSPADRVVIICPDFVDASRIFDQNDFSERHEFELSEQQRRDGVRVQYATIGELEKAVQTQNLTQFEFDELTVEIR
jgi:hypothetical protein